VAVVVPTRDRPDALARCLRAIGQQDRPADLVVVVDDGSQAAGEVAAVVAGSPRARLVRTEGHGPAAARNRGAAAAEGCDALVFTDDDCAPTAAWLDELVRAVEAGAEVVAGLTRCAPAAGPPDRAAQTITNHLLEESRGVGGTSIGFAPTCNLAVRTAVHAAVPFDEGFPLAAGEDRDWCARLVASGRTIGYAPRAVVEHRPDLTVSRFWRQQRRYGRGAVRFRAAGGPGRGRAPLGFYGRLLARGVRQGPAVGALVAAAQVATAAGVVQELVSERRRAAARRP
jgi:GT2 family glycosyltransferase